MFTSCDVTFETYIEVHCDLEVTNSVQFTIICISRYILFQSSFIKNDGVNIISILQKCTVLRFYKLSSLLLSHIHTCRNNKHIKAMIT